MRYVSATETRQSLAAVLKAAQREPIMIRRRKRDVAILLSAREYERLQGLNIEEFECFRDRISERAATRGLTEDKGAAIIPAQAGIQSNEASRRGRDS